MQISETEFLRNNCFSRLKPRKKQAERSSEMQKAHFARGVLGAASAIMSEYHKTHGFDKKDYGFELIKDEDGNVVSARKRTEADGGVYMLHLTAEDLERNAADMVKPYSVTENAGLNRVGNSISLVDGIRIKYGAGYLAVKAANVFVYPPSYDSDDPAYRASAGLNELIRWANGDYSIEREYGRPITLHNLYKNQEQTLDALKNAGIDTSKPFYINGAKFEIGGEGLITKIK